MEMALSKRITRIVAVTALAICLSACLLVPGKFVSDLDISKIGNFSFRYSGELVFLPLAEKSRKSGEFEAEPCYLEDNSVERACTADELAEQKSKWEQREARREKQNAESAKAFLGGIDPSDPKAAAEFSERLRRQAGWNKVEHRGNGVFDVEFAITGTLDHDFIFPTLEGMPMANSLVHVSKRSDGTVRIDAPGFGQLASPFGLSGLMRSAMTEGDGPKSEDKPVMDGRFTLRTNAGILANNTDEGPVADPVGQRLDWSVSARTPAAPTALLKLSD